MSEQAEIVKVVWLHLVKEGGRWIPREILQAIPSLQHVHMAQTLHDMFNNGMVTRFPIPGAIGRFSYGVTRSNKVPRAITVAELISGQVILECEE